MFDQEMDIEQPSQLLAYLRQRGLIEATECPRCLPLTGGVSNRAVLVRRGRGPAEDLVIKQALSKLRVAVDWYSDPARIHREALGLRVLAQLAPHHHLVPFVAEDDAQHILIMGAVPQPHENWKTLLMAGSVADDHVRQFAHLLAMIHRRSAEGAEEFSRLFADRTYFESLRLEPYYLYSAERVPAASAFIDELCRDTRRRLLSLVHGDYSPKNVLLYEGRLVLLDHEVIHWGDPAFDVGFALTHLLSKAHYHAHRREAFFVAARAFWTHYRSTLGDVEWLGGLEEFVVKHTTACLLARVVGRSPLEYLDAGKQSRQSQIILGLIDRLPLTVDDLIEEFARGINSDGNH